MRSPHKAKLNATIFRCRVKPIRAELLDLEVTQGNESVNYFEMITNFKDLKLLDKLQLFNDDSSYLYENVSHYLILTIEPYKYPRYRVILKQVGFDTVQHDRLLAVGNRLFTIDNRLMSI